MKKIYTLVITVFTLISFSACSTSMKNNSIDNDFNNDMKSINENQNNVTVNMPEPFENTNFGGDENHNYSARLNYKVDGLGAIVDNFTDYVTIQDIEEWDKKFSSNSFYASNLMDFCNLYSFIQVFNIPDEGILKGLNNNNEVYQRLVNEGYESVKNLIFTQEEIEIILSRDETSFLNCFATDYCIIVEDNIYSPAWIYTHSIEDYVNAGINENQMISKMDLYSSLPFTKSAKEAFEEKITLFTDENIELNSADFNVADSVIESPPTIEQQPIVTTTSPNNPESILTTN